MIPEKLKARLDKQRPSTSVTVRMPVDVVESMRAIAPLKGMSGYQALLKSYVSEGLRRDETTHLFGPAAPLAEALRKRGVPADVIEAAARDSAA